MIISQREARRLLKRVNFFETRELERNRRWSTEYPGGIHIGTEQFSVENEAAVKTARALGHAVVIVPMNKDRYVYIYGIRL